MTVYTAIFGEVDDLKEPFVVTPGWRYVCFTDQNFESNVWEIRKAKILPSGLQKTARHYKICFHKHIEDEFSLWVDGTFIINCDLNKWWERFQPPFTTVLHPFDNCIYTDAAACVRGGKADQQLMDRQIKLYSRLGVPKNNGLISSGVLMRQNTHMVRKMCNIWWRQVEAWTGRDQIAFGYVNHMFPEGHKSIAWDYTTAPEFLHIPHKTKKWRQGRFDEVFNKYVKK